MPAKPKPTSVQRLPSGCWHVRFGPQAFVQWPTWREATIADVFHGDHSQVFADAANEAVRKEKE